MVLATGLDGGQYSTPVTVSTSAATAINFGFHAHMVFFRAATSGGMFIDLSGAVATTSASYFIPAGGTLGPLTNPMGKTTFWAGCSVLSNTATCLFFPLALT